MNTAPKSMRLQIAIFGRTNVGKSSVLNMIAGQDVAITSAVPGTTTDVVEKSMELLPVGPVVFLDTAGLDDDSELGRLRTGRARKIFDRADVALIVTEAGRWGEWEELALAEAGARKVPAVTVINKADLSAPSPDFIAEMRRRCPRVVVCSALDKAGRDRAINELKEHLLELSKPSSAPRAILADLVGPGRTAVLIIPIDKEAPKGRIILPQVQAMRDLLDHGALSLTCREKEYKAALASLKEPPALVVCDSQVVDFMAANTPAAVPCTTFSILFARFKGELDGFVDGALAMRRLKPDARILVAEACSHHAIEDDIGRVKLPKWLKEYAGPGITIETRAGRDFPSDLSGYDLVIHCGGCMLTRQEVLNRQAACRAAGVPVTNYGLAIAECKGALSRVLAPFQK